jgi:signal transduction histidine kinase
MRKILLLAILCKSFLGSAQITTDDIAKLKTQWNATTKDSARMLIAGQLANGYRFSNVDSSLYYTDVALKYARKLHATDAEAALLSLKGATVLESGKLPESLQLQFEALDIAREIKDTSITAFALNRIGNAYMELADYKKANSFYFQSKKLFELIGNQAMYHNEVSNIGNVYELMGMADSALYFQQLVLKASEVRPDDRNFIVWPEMMFRLGNAYKLKGDKEKAMYYYKRGIIEANKDNDIRNLTMNNVLLAKLYNEMNETDSSLKYAYDAVQTGNTISFRKGIYDASLLISELYKKMNRADSAYKYLSVANVEKDSLTGTQRFQELQRITLEEQERRRETEARRIANQYRQKQIALIAGLAVFFIIAFILLRNNKQKQKTNKILEKTLSDLKATQSQLIQSEKMVSLGELTAGIAHEIQNPLNFVNNFSEVNGELIEEMKQELQKGNQQEALAISDHIRENEIKILQHGKRADEIVKSMLQHSRKSSGKKEPVDISAMADEYTRLAYHGLRARNKTFSADIQTDFDQRIGKIDVIPQDMGRVLLNLINNALYAVDEKRKMAGKDYLPAIKVSTKKLNGKIEINVADNGNGIAEKIKEKIFQPFFTTKPAGQGTGLGLSLSYDIIKAHGGDIKVNSNEGKGSEFSVILPLNEGGA